MSHQGTGGGAGAAGVNRVSIDFPGELRASLEKVAAIMNEAREAGSVYTFSILDDPSKGGFHVAKMTVTVDL